MRGDERMSFLVDMLFNIAIDMRYLLAILAAAVVVNGYANRLLRGDTEAYGNTAVALYSSYALLVHGDGVGEHDIYLTGCACGGIGASRGVW